MKKSVTLNAASDDLPAWHGLAVQIQKRLYPSTGASGDEKEDPAAALSEGEAEFLTDFNAYWLDHQPEKELAADASGSQEEGPIDAPAAEPVVPIDAETAIHIGRMAQTFHVVPDVFLGARGPGQITVIETGDVSAMAQTKDMIERGFFPPLAEGSETLPSGQVPGFLKVLAPDLSEGAVSDSARRSFRARVAKELKGQHPLVLVVPSASDLLVDLRVALGKPISLAAATAETFVYALSLTHDVPDRATRIALRQEFPGDAQIRGLTPEKILVACREGTALGVAAKLKAASGSGAKRPGIEALAGTGELETAARQIVSDLAAFRRGELAWSDIPRGLLLVGVPGTGKTYSVKCIAESAGVPLIEATVGGWQAAGHLGDMLKAMRTDFARAKSMQPVVLFIDELDSLGSRQSSDGHGISYRTQVVNEFLSLMDGASGTEGVLVIGATNHFASLDLAIVRPGRFDRLVQLGLPTEQALLQQVRRLLKTEMIDADIATLARAFRGSTPADVAATIRLARGDARAEGTVLTLQHVMALLNGQTSKSGESDQVVALHEAGHAVVAASLKIGSVEELRLTHDGGFTLVKLNPSTARLSALENHLSYVLAGYAAEQMIFGETSSGSGGPSESDLAKATAICVTIERSSGLGANKLVWEPAMAGDGGRPLAPDERKLVQQRLEAAVHKASTILQAVKPQLLSLARALLDQRHMTAVEIAPYLPTGKEVVVGWLDQSTEAAAAD
ncbi:MAG: AAA family ATPase [Candidatus Saccharibacteria bacterium]|nr:AAA family ATPase [Pseudorhodobacter sp.]